MFQAAREKIKSKKIHTELLDEVIQRLREHNVNQVHVKKINFQKTKQFHIFLEALKQCLTLESLHIENCTFNEDLFQKLTEALTQCVTLSWIFLTYNNLSEPHIKLIGENLREFRSLSCLNLSGNIMSEEAASSLCQNIPECPTLTTLVFDGKFTHINKQIINHLNENKFLIKKFHAAVKNLESSDYKDIFNKHPTLRDSYDEKSPILHELIDAKYSTRLIEFLETQPSPYHTDIVYSKTAVSIAKDDNIKNKNILQSYMNSYYKARQYPLSGDEKIEIISKNDIRNNNFFNSTTSSQTILPNTAKTQPRETQKIIRKSSMKSIVLNIKREEPLPEEEYMKKKNSKKMISITEQNSQHTSPSTFFTSSNYNNNKANFITDFTTSSISAPDSARASQLSPSSTSYQSQAENKEEMIPDETKISLLVNKK